MLHCLHASSCEYGALQCRTVHSFVASETACELFRLSAEAEALFLKEACFDHIMYNYDTIRVPAHARWLWHERACSDRTPCCGLGSICVLMWCGRYLVDALRGDTGGIPRSAGKSP